MDGLFFSSDVFQHIAVLCILAVGLFLFIQDKWRYDVVSVIILLAIIFVGILPVETAFSNFGHPAVIIVASMFVMGRALVQSGIIDVIVGKLDFLHHRPIFALAFLVIITATISGFVNNVGALVMVLPIAIHIAKKNKTPIALYLLPLAFASHLGGYLTLIGTPRNLLISDFRESTIGIPYQMFDFFHVGIFLAGFGALFLILLAWRMIPVRSSNDGDAPAHTYTTEAIVPSSSKILKLTYKRLHSLYGQTIAIAKVQRNEEYISADTAIRPKVDDVLILQGDADSLTSFVEKYRLKLSGLRAQEKNIDSQDEQRTVEVVVTPYAKIIGKQWNDISLPDRYGVNYIGFARRNYVPQISLMETRFNSGDILMLQGRMASIEKTISLLHCLIVSDEYINLGRTRTIFGTLLIFLSAIILATLNIFPVAVIFLTAATLMVLLNLIPIKQAYESIDTAILVLLVGMISLGSALQVSGADQVLAQYLLSLSSIIGAVGMLFLILITTMALSDFMNTTAAVVIMAPIAITIANV